MCLISGYYIAGVHKDRNKVRRLTPGGRKLECRYEKSSAETMRTRDAERNSGKLERKVYEYR